MLFFSKVRPFRAVPAKRPISDGYVKKAIEEGNDGIVYKNLYDPYLADNYGVFNPNQIKSATANNGDFSLTNNDIDAFIGKKKSRPSVNNQMSDDEKRNIRTLLKTINRTGTTLLDNGEGTMYLLEHADREDIENRNPQKQDGFNCILKFSTEGLSTEIINKIKEGIQNGTIRDQKTLNRRIKDCLEGQGSYVSDSIVAEVRATNADNAGLYSETQPGESSGERSNTSGSTNFRTGFIRVYENDGTKGARYIPIGAQESGVDFFQTSDGEIYGFVDVDGEVYFDKDAKGFSSEHVVHEYTHLWDRVIQKKNPKFWARGVYLMQHGAASLWNEIAESPQYGQKWIAMGLSGTELENKIASEVHARLTGEKGKELIEKIEKEQGPSGIIGKLKNWLKKFWGKLRETFGVWTDRDLAKIELDDFVNMPIRDFITEVDLDKAKEVVYKEDVEPEESFTWARTSPNSYEVSSKGDKRFSALNATFEPGTIVEGVDVGGKTIEWVYQNVIKKSKKGQPPAKDSIIDLDRKRPIKDIPWATEPAWIDEARSKLPDDLMRKVYHRYALDYTDTEITKEDKEDFSYYMGYKPLWQLWAKQHPELIADLKEKARGKVLTDQFANTRVSQARALAEILNSNDTDTSENPTDTSEDGTNFTSEQAHEWANEVVTTIQEALQNRSVKGKFAKDMLRVIVESLQHGNVQLGNLIFNFPALTEIFKNNNVSLQKLEAYAKVYPDDVITLDTWAREKGFGSDTDNLQSDETLPWEEEETDTGSDTDNSQPDMEHVNALANKIYNRFSDRAAEAHRKGDDNYEQLKKIASGIFKLMGLRLNEIKIDMIKQTAEKFGIDTTEIEELEEIINKKENKDFCSINTIVIKI